MPKVRFQEVRDYSVGLTNDEDAHIALFEIEEKKYSEEAFKKKSKRSSLECSTPVY